MHTHAHRYYSEDAVMDLEHSLQITDLSDEAVLPIGIDFEPEVIQRQHARLRGSVYVLLNLLAHAEHETAAAMQSPQHRQQQHACHWFEIEKSEDMQIC